MMTAVLAEPGEEEQPRRVDLAALRAFMLRLCGGTLPTGVVDDFIRERRRKAYAIRFGHEHGPA